MVFALNLEVLRDCIRRFLRAIQEDPAFTDEHKQLLQQHYLRNFTLEARNFIATNAIDCTPIRSAVRKAHLCGGFLSELGTLLECVKRACHRGPCEFIQATDSQLTPSS